MKKLLSYLSVGAVMAACALSASAKVSRWEGCPEAPQSVDDGRVVQLAPGMLKHRSGEETNATALSEMQAKTATPRALKRTSNGKSAPKAAAKASVVYGYCSYTGSIASQGWYEVKWSSSPVNVWEKKTPRTPGSGFVRGDEVYGFYTYSTSDGGLQEAGLYILDLATGALKATYETPIFDTLEQVVVMAAYDSVEDVAYVTTLDKTGNNYLLQKFDPKTRSFTSLGVNVPSDWLDMGWNPADKTLYLFDESGILKKYDSKAKKFSQVNSLSWDMADFPHAMVYSPKDEAFIILVESYDDDDYTCTDVISLPVSGSYKYLGTIPNNPQYRILYVPDKFVNTNAPSAPVLKSWDVEGAAKSGSFTVTLPSKYEGGADLTAVVYLQVKMDDATISGSYRGNPGADVTIPVSGEDGLHRFSVTPYILTDDGQMFGTPLVFDKCLGNDNPAAPTNVKLTESNVSWSAVTTGAHGGYVDASAIKYNVYIDKVLMNESPIAATSLDVKIPATGVVAHRAEVYALVGDLISEAGVSDRYYTDGALDLPVYLGPEEGESDLDQEVIAMFTVVKDALNQNETYRGWRYDDQSEHTGGFYCLSPKASSTGETANEWLFLPAINFTDKNAHYRLSMELWSGYHYFTAEEEIYEVALCKGPSARGATIIKDATSVYKNPVFEQAEALFQVPEEGEWYIGIHYISPLDSYRLYARNFRVEKAQASSTSPAAVTNLLATAAADGVLEATLTFSMPTSDISGNALDASSRITATAVCEGGEASITGAPGEKMTMKVPTVQGENIITVTTSSDSGQGLLAETSVYTGVYRPATPKVTVTVSDDNKTMTLAITPETYNENGEYTGPEEQTMTIYRKVGNEWRQAAEIGKDRTWIFEVPEPKQDIYAFGVGARNAVGYCDVLATVSLHLGNLYTLPLEETFPTQGEEVDFKEPISIEHLSYLQSRWGFTDPKEMDETASNSTGNALAAVWDGESQINLPRFTTKEMHNVKLDLSFFFGNLSPELITVYATSPSADMVEVAQYTATSGNGWEHKLISLPESCQDQGWVQITVRVKIVGYNQCFLMDYYSVKDYPANMVTICGMQGASRGAVGEKLTYNVEIENAGTSEVAMPSYTFRLLGDNGLMGDLTAVNAPQKLASGEKTTLTFDYTPKSADEGDVLVRFNLEGQPEVAVTEIDKQVKILAARVPVVTDLALGYGENGDINLSWTAPKFAEDFEVAEPWDYSETLRGFRNIDGDKAQVWGISEINFPGEGAPKGYQVFTSTSTQNQTMAAHSGEQYLLCMSPKAGVTNDWLISPEVKGGSKISFWMNICLADYPEVILVKYSTTGNNPEDFTNTLADGYVCPDEQGWAKYEFDLPADAKYFALHHVGEEGSEQFGFMIDDVAYEAANDAHQIAGYNLYRDNELIASCVNDLKYTDKGVDTSVPMRYHVKSVANVNGETVESERSNVVWATGGSNVEGVEGAMAAIAVVKGGVELRGFASGTAYSIADASGKVFAAGVTTGETKRVALPAGIYLVRCGAAVVKAII